MSITRISNTRNAGALLRYVLEDKAHNGSDERYISACARNCTINNVRSEFKAIRNKFNKNDNVQAYGVVISWGKDELNPDDVDDVDKALQVGDKVGLTLFGENRQYIVVAQRDGKGGNLHIHLVGNSIEMIHGKALRGKETNKNYLRVISDKIQQEMQIKNNNLVDKEYTEKQTIQEIKAREKGDYIWKDDLKQRIAGCVENPDIKSYSDYKESLLNDFGVIVKERKSNKKTAYQGYLLTYTFTDRNNKERRIREDKLGTVYGAKGVKYAITENINNTEWHVQQLSNTEHREQHEHTYKRKKSNRNTKSKSTNTIRQIEHANKQLEHKRERESRRLDELDRQLEHAIRKSIKKQRDKERTRGERSL